MIRAPVHRKEVHEITSPTNSLVKVFRRALTEGVTREGWLAIEGPFLLEEALSAAGDSERDSHAGCTVHSVLVNRSGAEKFPGLIRQLPKETEISQVPDRLFEGVTQTETPQGIAALVELPRHDIESVIDRPGACLVVACGIQDPGNLGTIMRSAQAFGGTALVALRDTANPFNPKAVRSSAGAVFRLPVFRNVNAEELFTKMRSSRVRIVACDRHSPTCLADADLRGPVAFLIGREAAGLDEGLLNEADLRLSIPLRPQTDSVNAGVAAAIFLYEAARQRGFRY